jgi:hypothetical protein
MNFRWVIGGCDFAPYPVHALTPRETPATAISAASAKKTNNKTAAKNTSLHIRGPIINY